MSEISIHTPDCPAGLSPSGACACGAQPKPVFYVYEPISLNFSRIPIAPMPESTVSVGEPFPLEVDREHAATDHMAIDAAGSPSSSGARGAQPVHFGPDGWPTEYKRPPVTEVPLYAHHFAWREPVNGGWREHMSKVILGACAKCALYWRMWEDEPRPCPSCTERDARQAES